MFKALFAIATCAYASEAEVVKTKLDALTATDAEVTQTDAEVTEVMTGAEANYTSGTAVFTYYESYPRCCKDCGNYDSSAPKDECSDYSGCKYCGDFADGSHESLSWVKSNDIISFFSVDGGWNSKYKDKKVQLTKGSVSFTAIVKDTCGDSDCGGCCTKNAGKYGYLVDMEYFTVKRHFGSTSAADGTISFKFLE